VNSVNAGQGMCRKWIPNQSQVSYPYNMHASNADSKIYLEDEMSRDPKFGASDGKDTALGTAVVATISEHCGSMYADIFSSANL
jgi:hypothetical protein